MNESQQIEYPITDGFLLNTNIRCNLRFLAMAIAQWEAIRRASGFRTKAWCVPEDSSLALIPAYDSYEYQVSCAPGSVVWGYRFVDGSRGSNQYSIQLQDACNDVPVFSEPILMNQAPSQQDGIRPLPKLLVIGSGLLNVTICNLGATAVANTQLVLYGGEPAC